MNTQALTELLTELIAIPSVNPAHSNNPKITGERRMALYLRDRLVERGLDVAWLEYEGPDRPAVLGTAGAPDATRSLMFEVHLDTVGVDHMTIPPFQGYQQDGRIYGRGACDMKGSTASLLHALTPERVQALTARGIRLMVLGAPDEECGIAGASRLVREGIRADHAVVLEPTNCVPVIAHMGVRWYEIELRGKSGHGSRPDSGVSTNAALARLLPELLRAHKALQDMARHPLLGQSTLNIGRIEGGHAYNIIPDRTIIHLDRRVVPNEKPELFEQAVQHILDELRKEGRILSGECRPQITAPAFATPEGGDLPRQLLDAVEAESGSRPTGRGTAWVSDASALGSVCGETVVFGPGDIAQAHTEDEFIEIEDLEKGARIFARFLDTYAL